MKTVEEMNDALQEYCNGNCEACVVHDLCDQVLGDFEFNKDICEEAYNRITHSNVDHPSHYNQGGIECLDAMIAAFGKESVKEFCICNAFKYIFRFKLKNGMEDIDKALWYLNKYKELSDET